MNWKLKCCGKKNPLGVDKQNIRLSFTLCGSLQAVSYELVLRELASGCLACVIKGQPEDLFTHWVDPAVLRDQTSYVWQVSVKTADGKTVESEPGYFETGISCWQAEWIGVDAQPGQVLEFTKTFLVEEKPKKARLYICGVGYFRPQMNGMPLSDSYFIPPVTDYTTRPQFSCPISGHRITYYTYDVTQLLQKGSNVLGAEVSDGYYSNWEKVFYEPLPDMSFGQSGLIYELHLEDETGVRRIVSGTDTQVRVTNAVSRLYGGDVIDFTREPGAYQPAKRIVPPDGVMTSPICEDDRVNRVLTPVKTWQAEGGTVFDFGINHSGGLQLTALSQGKTTLRVRFAEIMNADGSLNFETGAFHAEHIENGTTKDIYQGNTYYLQDGSNTIAPRFSWFCYRYALILHEESVVLQDVKSLFICMDVEQDGEFSCEDTTLTGINDMFLQTLRCNMHSGILSDCPHRERLPYTGDGGLVMKSVYYNLSALDFYYKWFQDILDSQYENGMIPNTATHLGGGGGYAWGNALCIVTKQLYVLTGDKLTARKGYEAIKRWLGYYDRNRDEHYIIHSNSHLWLLGDWLAPEVVSSNVYYISTVCYLQAAKTALFLAEILEPADCEKWESLQSSITDGINRVFFDRQKLIYGNGVQGENMLALAEDIVPEPYREQMETKLRHHYTEETQYHLDTGIVLTPVLINYLTDHGFRDLAFRIMTAKTYPSYFCLMKNDTTFSEHWSKKWPDYYIGEAGNSKLIKGGTDLSHCHPMFGSVAAWLYDRVAGLDLSRLYERKVFIRPYFMDCLHWAKAKKKTPFGYTQVAWSAENGECSINLSVPKSLTADCHFPAVCASLTDRNTGKTFYPDPDGYFRFSLAGGDWSLTSKPAAEEKTAIHCDKAFSFAISR